MAALRRWGQKLWGSFFSKYLHIYRFHSQKQNIYSHQQQSWKRSAFNVAANLATEINMIPGVNHCHVRCMWSESVNSLIELNNPENWLGMLSFLPWKFFMVQITLKSRINSSQPLVWRCFNQLKDLRYEFSFSLYQLGNWVGFFRLCNKMSH